MATNNSKYLVVGAGKSGLATALFLAANKFTVTLVDDNELNYGQLQVRCNNYNLPPQWHQFLSSLEIYRTKALLKTDVNWSEFLAVVLSPGVPTNFPKPHALVQIAKRNKLAITSDIDILLNNLPIATKVIGITGTNGKSTTTALLAHALSFDDNFGQVVGCGNIGQPVLTLLAAKKLPQTIVIELSSYQLEITNNPRLDVALWTNISPDHQDRYRTHAEYVAAKARIVSLLKKGGVAIIGCDQPDLAILAEELQQRFPDRQVQHHHHRDYVNLPWKKLGEKLPGHHNQLNISQVVACVKALGLEPTAAFIDHLATFNGLPHRLQPVPNQFNLKIYNDSKATNMVAASTALASFERVIWLCGGMYKGDELLPVEAYLDRVEHIFTFGEASTEFATKLANLDNSIKITTHDTLKAATIAAINFAKSQTSPPTIVLAPAGSSFDEFKNFEARGDAFMEYVNS